MKTRRALDQQSTSSQPNFSRDLYGFPQPKAELKHRKSRIPREITQHDAQSSSLPEMLPSLLHAKNMRGEDGNGKPITVVELERDIVGLKSVLREQQAQTQTTHRQNQVSDGLIADVIFYEHVSDELQCQLAEFHESATNVRFPQKRLRTPVVSTQVALHTGKLTHLNLDPQLQASSMCKLNLVQTPAVQRQPTTTYNPKSSQVELDTTIIDVLRFDVLDREVVQPLLQPKLTRKNAIQRYDYANQAKTRKQRLESKLPITDNTMQESSASPRRSSVIVGGTQLSASTFNKESSSQHVIKKSLLEQKRILQQKQQNIGRNGSTGVIVSRRDGSSEVSFDSKDAEQVHERQARRFSQLASGTEVGQFGLPPETAVSEEKVTENPASANSMNMTGGLKSLKKTIPRLLQPQPTATVDTDVVTPSIAPVTPDGRPKLGIIDSRVHTHLQLPSGFVSNSRRALMPSNQSDIHELLTTSHRNARRSRKAKSMFAKQQNISSLHSLALLDSINEDGTDRSSGDENMTMQRSAQSILDHLGKHPGEDALQALRALGANRSMTHKHTPLHLSVNAHGNRDTIGSLRVTEDKITSKKLVHELQPAKLAVNSTTTLSLKKQDKYEPLEDLYEFKRKYAGGSSYSVTNTLPCIGVVTPPPANKNDLLYPSNSLDTLMRTAKAQSLSAWSEYLRESTSKEQVAREAAQQVSLSKECPLWDKLGMTESELEWLRETVREKTQWRRRDERKQSLKRDIEKKIVVLAHSHQGDHVVVQRTAVSAAEKQRARLFEQAEQRDERARSMRRVSKLSAQELDEYHLDQSMRMANPRRLAALLDRRKSQSKLLLTILQDLNRSDQRENELRSYLQQCRTIPLVQTLLGTVLPRSLLLARKKRLALSDIKESTRTFSQWITKKSEYVVQTHSKQAKIMQTMSSEACKTLNIALLTERDNIAREMQNQQNLHFNEVFHLKETLESDLTRDLSALRGVNLFRHAVKRVIYTLRAENTLEKTDRKAMRRIVLRKRSL